ncbi:MAG: TraR/DksA C4-type zinc finger protein [Kiritimatiellae bacterium]|nr:TraR/DksA C4-type zinc finger protein [Kiritimatiellia bacterium]
MKLTKKDLEFFRKQLLNLRDRLVDGISFLAGDNLGHAQREASGDLSNYGMHMADQGTDNFDREFALSLVSNEQEVLYEIDEALQRIEQGEFGICEMTGVPIEYERLKVLPYARYCIAAQQEMERNRRRFRSFAPHAPIPSGGDL